MNRRNFLRHAGSATALFYTQPNFSTAANAGPADDEILAGAKERIAQHRQGECVVPEVRRVHVSPLVEVRMVPSFPTAT